jgi:thiosulfate/3-mercaptopyruvate sulfurtransferase
MSLRWTIAAVFALAWSGALAQGSGSQPSLRSEMLVTTEWLAEHLQDPDLVVLCIGSSREFYEKGHIPGARQITLAAIAITRDGIPNELPAVEKLQQLFAAAGVSNRSRVVLYGERFNLLAARAYFTLDYLGIAGRAALLDGGLEKWRAEGRPLSTERPAVRPVELTVNPRPEILVSTDRMKALAAQRDVVLIDARPQSEYSGEQLSEEVQHSGHIPGATSLYWMEMLASRENPVLKPEAELRRLYAEAHAQPGQPLITYCRTGMQSSFDYFVAKYLGYEPAMYDASFYEWSLKNLPAESSSRESNPK